MLSCYRIKKWHYQPIKSYKIRNSHLDVKRSCILYRHLVRSFCDYFNRLMFLQNSFAHYPFPYTNLHQLITVCNLPTSPTQPVAKVFHLNMKSASQWMNFKLGACRVRFWVGPSPPQNQKFAGWRKLSIFFSNFNSTGGNQARQLFGAGC